jgi:hypothetical protein
MRLISSASQSRHPFWVRSAVTGSISGCPAEADTKRFLTNASTFSTSALNLAGSKAGSDPHAIVRAINMAECPDANDR